MMIKEYVTPKLLIYETNSKYEIALSDTFFEERDGEGSIGGANDEEYF